MGVQNFLKGGLLRESVRYKIYIGAIEGARGGKREISRRTVSIATIRRKRDSIGFRSVSEAIPSRAATSHRFSSVRSGA